jgi:hypothetical protein
MAAALAGSTPSGTAKALEAGITTVSASPPPVKTTRWPTATPSTPLPRADTTPAVSPPGVNPGPTFTWYMPRHISTSGKARPTASTCTATVPGPGAGVASSTSRSCSRGSPSSCNRQMRMAGP